MTKTVPAILVFALTCLFALSSALPSVLRGESPAAASTQTELNVPRMLLGKPYQGRWNSQGFTQPRRIVAITDHNDPSDANIDADLDHGSARQAQIGNDSRTQTKMDMDAKQRVPLPLPPVLDMFPQSRQAGLRLSKLKRPMLHSPCLEIPVSKEVQFEMTITGHEGEQCAQSPIVSGPERKKGAHDVPVRGLRLKRLYDRGEWKSRLSEGY